MATSVAVLKEGGIAERLLRSWLLPRLLRVVACLPYSAACLPARPCPPATNLLQVAAASFDLLFAFDEVISLGHKENVTAAQVWPHCLHTWRQRDS